MLVFTKVGHIQGTGTPTYLKGAYVPVLYTVGATLHCLVTGHEDHSLSMFDVSNPASPTLTDSIEGSGASNYLGGAAGLECFTDTGTEYAAVVSFDDDALGIFDISTPATIALSDSVQGAGAGNYLGGAYDLAIATISSIRYACVASIGDNALSIFNINTPATISQVGEITGNGTPNYLGQAHGVAVKEITSTWYAWVVGAEDDSLSVFNINTPASPSLVVSVQGSAYHLDEPHSIIISGDNAYITNYGSDELCIIDISTPATPVYKGAVGSAGFPDYFHAPCDHHVQVIDTVPYIVSAAHLDDALVAVKASDPTSPGIAGKILGPGVPNYLAGVHGVVMDTTHVYAASYDDNALVAFSYEVIAGLSATIGITTDVSGEVQVGNTKDISATIDITTSVTGSAEVDMTDFIAEVQKPHWYPVKKVYMVDAQGAEIDITDKVQNIDQVLWQVEQIEEGINEFTANTCAVDLKNEDQEFDIDIADNYFVSTLGQPQDGYKVPVVIKYGYKLPDDTLSLVNVFYGLIIDVNVSTDNDLALIDLQCVSRYLRDADCKNVGDLIEAQQLYGGNTTTELSNPVLADTSEIQVSGIDFPDSFPASGYFRIGDEIIFYGEKTTTGFKYCLRGRKSTSAAIHGVGATVWLMLADGSDTEGRKFQFPLYPIVREGVDSITSSDGTIEILRSNELILGVSSVDRQLTAAVEFDTGVLELGAEPTDSSSLVASYRIVPRGIPYHTLVRRLLDAEGMDRSLVEDVQLSDRLKRTIPVTYGRVTHARQDDSYTSMVSAPAFSMAANDDYVYMGIGRHLVRWDEENYDLVGSVGNGEVIIRLGIDSNGNVYGVSRPDDLASLGNIFKYDGQSIAFIKTGDVAAYRHTGFGREGAQWKGFEVDDTNNVIWFLYEDGTRGIAKINFDGTGYTKYDRPVKDAISMDFADSGDNVEFFYAEVTGGAENLEYDTLVKSTGLWTARGTIKSITEDTDEGLIPMDVVYNWFDGNVYLNILYVKDNNEAAPNDWDGWFTSLPLGTTTETDLVSYVEGTAGKALESRYCGGISHNGYAWYVRGTGLAIGGNIADTAFVDDATGNLYRINDNAIEDMGGIAYRQLTTGEKSVAGFDDTQFFVRENVKGISAVMASRTSDQAMFMFASDATVRDDQRYGYALVMYAQTFTPVVREANWAERQKWSVMSELAKIANFELGVSTRGKVFFRKRAADRTVLAGDITSSDTVVLSDGSNMDDFDDAGKIQIDVEIMEYTGKTAGSFTGCSRGQYDSVAIDHPAGAAIHKVDHVIINMDNLKLEKAASKTPNWDEIYNYVVVQVGDTQVICDWQETGEAFTGSSEAVYGRRKLEISNIFLTNDDIYIAEAAAWRAYDFWKDRHGLAEVETKWQPQIELGQVLSIRQQARTRFDYAIARIRRIEMESNQFFIRILAMVYPSRYRSSVYDYGQS